MKKAMKRANAIVHELTSTFRLMKQVWKLRNDDFRI